MVLHYLEEEVPYGERLWVLYFKTYQQWINIGTIRYFLANGFTGLIILLAVGIDLVRQSKNPKNVRRLLVSVSSFMAFLTLMTPASLFLRAQISILEHNASKSIQEAGEKLANGQTARLLGPKEIDYFQQIISSNSWISVLCLLLFIVSLIPIFTVN